MAREEFVRNFRNALSHAAQPANNVEPPADGRITGVAVVQAKQWLSKKSIEGFDADDFSELPVSQGRKLNDAVDEFRNACDSLAPDAPMYLPGDPAIDLGWPAFCRIREIVGGALRDEWVRDVTTLLQDAQRWCLNRDWAAGTRSKQTLDSFLGVFNIDQLFFRTESTPMLVDPVARFAVGASGLIDLLVIPTYESVMITRVGGEWFIQGLPGKTTRRKWSEDAFVAAVAMLSESA